MQNRFILMLLLFCAGLAQPCHLTAQEMPAIDPAKLAELDFLLFEQRPVTEESFSEEMRLAEVLSKGRYWKGLVPQAERLVEYADKQSVSAEDRDRILNWHAAALLRTSQYRRAERAYQKLIEARTAAAQPDIAKLAIAYNNLALVQQHQGKLEAADANLSRARQISNGGTALNGVDRAQFLSNQAELLNAAGRYREAEPLHHQAVAAFGKLPDASPSRLAIAVNYLGANLLRQGRFQQADQTFARAHALTENLERPDPEFQTMLANNRGYSLFRQDRFLEAEPFLRDAIRFGRGLARTNHGLLATAYNNLGLAQLGRGLTGEAERTFGQAGFVFVSRGDIRNPLYARILSNQASAKERLGRVAEARADYGYALTQLEKLYGPDHPNLTGPLKGLAGLALRDGRPKVAELAFKRIVTIFEKISNGHPDLPNALNNLASSLADQGKIGQAEQYYRRAVNLERAQRGPDSPALADMMVYLSDVRAQQNPADKMALKLAQQAVAIAERRRNRQQFGGLRGGAIAQAIGSDAEYDRGLDATYSHLIKIISEGHGGPKSLTPEGYALRDQAFKAAQAIGTSKTAQLMTQTALRKSLGDDALAALLRQQQELVAKIRDIDREINTTLSLRYLDEAEKLRLVSRQTGKELDQLNRELDNRFPDYQRLTTPRWLSIDEVRQQLQPNEAAILVTTTARDVVSFGISTEGHSWSRLADGAMPLANIAKRLRCQLDPKSCPKDFFDGEPESTAQTEGYLPFDRARAHHLYERLVKPYADRFGPQVDTLYIVTNGPLSAIPFSTLVTQKPEPGDDADPDVLAAMPWLSDRFAITHLPSLSVLRSLTGRDRRTGAIPFMGFGAPSLSGTESPGRNRGTMGGFFRYAAGQRMADTEVLRNMVPLPGTRRELNAISRIMGADSNLVFTGLKATEPAVRENRKLSQARIVSFATHGILPANVDGLAEPGLVFTPPEKASLANDGLLAASEAAQLNLSADWVILSACNTATSDGTGAAHSLSSLSQAFLHAGARALLASHWYVGDDSTAVLTTETLRNWKTGTLTRGKALQRAMQTVRTGRRSDGSEITEWLPQWSHPSAWAAFTHISYVDE